MGRPSLTIAIASHQRRDRLLQLMGTLDRQFAADSALREDARLVVVLDGSTDGSREALEARDWAVPVEVVWQPNRGLAAARNVGLAAAGDGVVWFLDDDLLVPDGVVARHRAAHDGGRPFIFVGPCRIPPDVPAPGPLRRWWDEFYGELERTRVITRFDRFTTANASMPASTVAAVGGFDESFVAYGLEDYELGVRLLAANTEIRYDAGALVWHPNVPALTTLIEREYGVGQNTALLAQRHPSTLDLLMPAGRAPAPRRLLRRLRLRSPERLLKASRLAMVVWRVLRPLSARLARPVEHFSRASAHAAGVADADPSGALLDRLLDVHRHPGHRA